MASRFIVSLSVWFVLAQGSHIFKIEPETVVEAHGIGGVTSGAPIRFPEVRSAPQTQSSAGGYRGGGANPVPRPGIAPRPSAAPRPQAAPHPAAPALHRSPGGSHSRPLAGALNTPGAGYGNSHRNRNHNQKAFPLL